MNVDVSVRSVEQVSNFICYSRHDYCVEQYNETCEEQSADYNGDDDLDSSINVSLAGGVQRSCLEHKCLFSCCFLCLECLENELVSDCLHVRNPPVN